MHTQYYKVGSVEADERRFFYIYEALTGVILSYATKYLKHKSLQNCKMHTVRRIAFHICYYLNYLHDTGVTVEDILRLKYLKQQEHFTDYLQWLKAGRHCDRGKAPLNDTCNAYLKSIFGFYEFLVLQYELSGEITVLEARDMNVSTSAGVRVKKSINCFKGYLDHDQYKIKKTATEDEIITLLEACSCVRNQVLILIMAELGYRVGEALGIRLSDIDYERRSIRVVYRNNNVNHAYAKYAEGREGILSQETMDLLMQYIAETRELLYESDYLFINLHGRTKGRPMNVNATYSMLRTLEKQTGIKITPHSLRRYYAKSRKQYWDLNLVRAGLGQKGTKTTEIYLQITDKELLQAQEEYMAANRGLYDLNKLLE